jgi:hypothetical protein
MKDHRQQRGLLTFFWLALAVVLVLLLVIGATQHQVSNLWFVFVQVFLFSVVIAYECPLRPETEAVPSSQLSRPSLFQRPPPSLI